MKYALVILIAIGTTLGITRAEVESSSPYLYYYSQVLGGFVVERADGSDSRLFSVGYAAGNPWASNPGWSASGEWFSWFSQQGYVDNIAGQLHFDVLEHYRPHMNNVVSMEWSPQANILFFIGSQQRHCLCVDETTFVVRDMDAGRDLATFSLPVQYTYPLRNFSPPMWDIDEGSVGINVLVNGSSANFEAVHITLHFTGAVDQISLSEDTWNECCSFPAPPGFQTNINWNGETFTSPSGRYETAAVSNTVLLDRQSGEITTLPAHSGATLNTKWLKYHPSETWALSGQTDFVSGGCCEEPLLVGVTTIAGTYWRELGLCFRCAEWLPEHVDPDMLPEGAPTSVLPAPIETQYHDEIIYGWRDGNAHLSCSPDTPSDYVLRLTDTGTSSSSLHFDAPCRIPDNMPQEVLAAVSPDNQLLALSMQSHGYLVTLWNIQTGAFLGRLNTFGYDMAFSADSRELSTRTTRATLTWDLGQIIDLPNK